MPRVPLVALRCLREPPPAGALIVKAAWQRNVSVQVNGAEKLEVEHRNLRPQDADAGQMTGWTHDNGNEGLGYEAPANSSVSAHWWNRLLTLSHARRALRPLRMPELEAL